ncbi:Dicer-like protein 2 [Parahypoxylon ruwenzoriense]
MRKPWPPPLLADSDSESSGDEEDLEPIIVESHEDPHLSSTGPPETGQVEDLFVEEEPSQDPVVIHAREYQLEMFEESLRRNIIVAMETGTGKTQVIQAELGKSISNKIVWFLAPTVALCEQQFKVLTSQIPAVQIKFLSGADGVDTWSNVRTWDDYLKNVRIVISTYQVLLDAICHAFVSIDRLSLIVFDEAHNCVGKHPGKKIMDRYREYKAASLPVPSILGLTASPIMRSELDGLERIEKTLDAICRSPTIHREELLSAVKRPDMCLAFYLPPGDVPWTSTMASLARVYHSLDIYQDPYIVRRRADKSERGRAELLRALEKRDTYTSRQMQSLLRKSMVIQQELGSWAADYFLSVTVTQFLESVKGNNTWFQEWGIEEKHYLAKALGTAEIPTPPPFEDDIAHTDISDKFKTLVQELSACTEGAMSIIFVREIATVAVLSHMLSVHPLMKDRFRIGTMIGANNRIGQKRDLGYIGKTSGYQDLDEFRKGRLNLLIATSVLEEGIDVPACNMVICFDKPDNLKAFIQRRGRARMRESKLLLLVGGPTCQLNEWTKLEEEMKNRYEEDMRQIQELAELESEKSEVKPLYIPTTGAKLDFDQAKSHLEHFCRSLSTRQHSQSQPYYIFEKRHLPWEDRAEIKATVLLPMSLPPELRRVESSGFWYSEKNASKDAAFQAFVAIYEAGLLNDNFMPLKDEILVGVETRAALTEAHQQWSPWTRIARAWDHPAEIYQRRLRLLDQEGDIICEFKASLPIKFPELSVIKIYWDKTTSWIIEAGEMEAVSMHDLSADQSPALIDLAYRHRRLIAKDTQQVLHFQSPTEEIPFQVLFGQKTIEEASFNNDTVIIRNSHGHPCFFEALLPYLDLALHVPSSLVDEPADQPWLVLKKWPRRRDFLHPFKEDPSSPPPKKPGQTAWPAYLCRVDSIDVPSVYFGTLIPSITHVVEVNLVAIELCETILKDVGFSDISLVITAISSPAANEASNYQRLEFLGDSILKMLTTATVTANHPLYPEGYLDAIKVNIVSNSRLYRSAIDTGLDKFIFTKKFTAAKWQPLYVEDLREAAGAETDEKRTMSTKTLADVIEALIGAAYLDGGMSKAMACLKIFIPEVKWLSLESACDALFKQTAISTELIAPLVPLEELLGYSFRNKNLLVEAATHSSFGLISSAGSCMERLEFLGDAVLDSIVVSLLWSHERELSQQEMHLLRTASVNADLLGFLGMEWSAEQEATNIVKKNKSAPTSPLTSPTLSSSSSSSTTTTPLPNPPSPSTTRPKPKVETQTTTARIPFFKFLRHVSAEMHAASSLATSRHAASRLPILAAIVNAQTYPWAALAALHIPKFFSDLFEAVLGAVWVDCGGCLDTCAHVAHRAGILPYLRRLLADAVDVLHPKNKLGELAAKRQLTVEYKVQARDSPAIHPPHVPADGSPGNETRDSDSELPRGDSGRELFCAIIIADEPIVEVGGGVSYEEIQTKAADAAYKILKERFEKEEVDAGKEVGEGIKEMAM